MCGNQTRNTATKHEHVPHENVPIQPKVGECAEIAENISETPKDGETNMKSN